MMDGPEALGLGSGAVLLRGRAVVDTARAVSSALDVAVRRDGLTIPPRLLELRRTLDLEARAVAAAGLADGRQEVNLPSLTADVWSSKKAATVLGLSERHTRRLSSELGARKVGARWCWDSLTVAAAADERRRLTHAIDGDHSAVAG